jgi:hypothetical protein
MEKVILQRSPAKARRRQGEGKAKARRRQGEGKAKARRRQGGDLVRTKKDQIRFFCSKGNGEMSDIYKKLNYISL